MPPGGSGTRSGQVFEHTVVPALEHNGYKVTGQKIEGIGLGGGSQRTDKVVVSPSGDEFVVSLKWQGGGGSVDEKVPYEVIKLLHLMRQLPRIARAYIVLAGDGWRDRLLKFYLEGGLNEWIPEAHKVRFLTLNQFLHACNRKAL